jgi:nucleotide-binding universal stress UspA family protein
MASKISNYKVKPTNMEVRKILVAVDGSDAANKALGHAIDFSRLKGAELLIIYAIGDVVTEPMSVAFLGTGQGKVSISKSFYEEARAAAEGWIQLLVEKSRLAGVERTSGEVLFKQGKSVVELITRYAKDNEIDLIVMGTTGRGTFKRLLLGSVASGVLNHAQCSVLVVR